LPWQRYVADVIGERTSSGRYRYPLVVVTVPRQTGKTTWALDLALGRCMVHSDYRVAYTAQTGHITTERFADRGPVGDVEFFVPVGFTDGFPDVIEGVEIQFSLGGRKACFGGEKKKGNNCEGDEAREGQVLF